MSSIAHAAGLNEVTVYRYFPQKQQLHWEAVAFKLRESNFFEDLLGIVRGKQAPVDLLQRLGETIIGAIDRDPTIARLIGLTIFELGRERTLLLQLHLQPFVRGLKTRIESWIESGDIRPVDPETGATAMVGMLLTHCAKRSLLGITADHADSPNQSAAEYAAICMHGIQPDNTE